MIYLDIETTSNEAMIPFLPEPKAPRNYKKAESIAKWTAEAKQKQTEKAALDLDAARIISIAVAKDDDRPVGWVVADERRQEDTAEREIVGKLWDWITPPSLRRFAGYNIRKFDLPILLRRSWQLGIAPPVNIMSAMSRANGRVIDLMELLYHQGYTSTSYRSLKFVCQACGIPNPLLDADGSMVGDMTADELLTYNLNDVKLTRELARITEGYYWFDNIKPLREEIK